MAITTVTSIVGNTTFELSSGTAQEVVDRLAVLMVDRVYYKELEILSITGGATVYVALRYRTTVANP